MKFYAVRTSRPATTAADPPGGKIAVSPAPTCGSHPFVDAHGNR